MAFSILVASLMLASSAEPSCPEANDAAKLQECDTTASQQGADTGFFVPEPWDYVRMTPEERMALREKVNSLPPEQKKQNDAAMHAMVGKLPTWIYEALSFEMVELNFCSTGTYTGPKSKPPMWDAWQYVEAAPHLRYHFRVWARALEGADKEAYEKHWAEEMSKLPAWLQKALEKEAERYDGYFGTDPCDSFK